jgi:hypothetical protein
MGEIPWRDGAGFGGLEGPLLPPAGRKTAKGSGLLSHPFHGEAVKWMGHGRDSTVQALGEGDDYDWSRLFIECYTSVKIFDYAKDRGSEHDTQGVFHVVSFRASSSYCLWRFGICKQRWWRGRRWSWDPASNPFALGFAVSSDNP